MVKLPEGSLNSSKKQSNLSKEILEKPVLEDCNYYVLDEQGVIVLVNKGNLHVLYKDENFNKNTPKRLDNLYALGYFVNRNNPI